MKLKQMTIFVKATLLAAMTAPVLILPAYGQQDVNPTWYNPWPDAPKPAARPAPAKITQHKDAGATHSNHSTATQVKQKQRPVQEPVRTAEALPPKVHQTRPGTVQGVRIGELAMQRTEIIDENYTIS